VQTKEDIEDALQAAVEREKRYVVCFEKGQGKFGTEAKEKAERAKRQLAKLRKEFRFQGWIERAEHRGTTQAQIERVYACLEENCSAWVDHLPAKMSKTSGKPLRIDFLNFYHLSNNLILPVTKPRRCSFVEMMTNQAHAPSWFLSHWWGLSVQGFVASVEKHAATRGLSADSSYWTWTFACRLLEKQSEICENPTKALFYKPMETCKFKLLLIIDQQAVCFKRSWCLYETAMTVDTNLAMVDCACVNNSGGSELITHGLTEDEEKMETQRPGHGVRPAFQWKSQKQDWVCRWRSPRHGQRKTRPRFFTAWHRMIERSSGTWRMQKPDSVHVWQQHSGPELHDLTRMGEQHLQGVLRRP